MSTLVQQSVENVCAKLCWSFKSFPIGACQSSAHHPEIIPQRNSFHHENYNIRYPLNTFSDQITICQISFEIYTCFCDKTKYLNSISVFSVYNFSYIFHWNEINWTFNKRESQKLVPESWKRDIENIFREVAGNRASDNERSISLKSF